MRDLGKVSRGVWEKDKKNLGGVEREPGKGRAYRGRGKKNLWV